MHKILWHRTSINLKNTECQLEKDLYTLIWYTIVAITHKSTAYIHVADRFTYITRDITKLNIYMQFVMLVCNLLLKSNTCNKLRIDTC